MSEDYIIEISKLTKRFGEHVILNDLNFNVPANKITTILGFSGAGKSTLIKHMLGLLRPTSGEVKVLGQNISKLEGFKLRDFRKNFGMLFQYAALFDSFTTFDNVAFPIRELTNKDEGYVHDKVAKLLISVGIQEDSFYKLPSELSGGMRKRVGLARALALQPKIMLYDEPTTGLDPITTNMVNELIVGTTDQYKDQGITSVIISHDIRATLKISDFVAFLDHGNIIEYLPVEEFKQSDNPMVKQFINL